MVFGFRRFNPKIVAFRNDFCLSCGRPRRAYQVRTHNFLTILFVPVFPLGSWHRWACSVCDRSPHAQPNLAKIWQWVIVGALAFASIGAWIGLGEDIIATWFGRLLIPPLLFLMLRYTLKSKPDVRLKDKLKEVPPGDETACPLCSQALALRDGWKCSGCGLKRIPLRVTLQ